MKKIKSRSIIAWKVQSNGATGIGEIFHTIKAGDENLQIFKKTEPLGKESDWTNQNLFYYYLQINFIFKLQRVILLYYSCYRFDLPWAWCGCNSESTFCQNGNRYLILASSPCKNRQSYSWPLWWSI
jgi:hypothetical protein